MSEQGLWALFCRTGRPEAYTLYCLLRRARRQREKGADQDAKSA